MKLHNRHRMELQRCSTVIALCGLKWLFGKTKRVP